MFRPGTSDGFNRYSNRNMRNTPKWKYNCAGYALGIFSWYCPYDAEVGHHFGDYDMTDEFSPLRSQALMECITQMLADFDDLRVIHSLKELEENEYAIAFRLSWDDFHYMRRADNGHWYEKRGSEDCIRTVTVEEVFSDNWHGRYDGNIVLFAKGK